MITEIINGLLLLLTMILLHEFGHWIVFKRFKINYKFTFNKEHIGFDFLPKNKNQRFLVYWVAVLLGLTPIVFFPFKVGIYTSLFVIAAYLWGIGHDIKEMKRCFDND